MSKINAVLATGDGQETPKDVADVRTDKPRRVKLDGGKTPSRNLDGDGGDSSTDRSLVLDDAAPVRPFYDRYIPGGYRRDRQLSLQGRKLTLACEIFGGVASTSLPPAVRAPADAISPVLRLRPRRDVGREQRGSVPGDHGNRSDDAARKRDDRRNRRCVLRRHIFWSVNWRVTGRPHWEVEEHRGWMCGGYLWCGAAVERPKHHLDVSRACDHRLGDRDPEWCVQLPSSPLLFARPPSVLSLRPRKGSY